MIIGIDFDNTIINYDQLIYSLALQKSFIPPATNQNKKDIRDTIRKLPNGDLKWQEIQAQAYGDFISHAILNPGIQEFFQLCHQQNIPYYIISHKTKYSNLYKTGTDLQKAALNWMAEQKLFNTQTGLTTQQIYFEPTQEQKIARIKILNCTHFIDDLEETFQFPTFPKETKKILYNPHFNKNPQNKNNNTENTPKHNNTKSMPNPLNNLHIASSFQEISEIITAGIEQEKEERKKEDHIKKSAQELLNKTEIPQETITLNRIEGGKNNQVYLLTTKNRNTKPQKYLLKVYYSHPNDQRNRLETEFTSLSYLWEQGIRTIPKPIIKSSPVTTNQPKIALYTFIEGTKITPEEITESDIDAAASFLKQINKTRQSSPTPFTNASDACFTTQDYINIIHRRLQHLNQTPNHTAIQHKLHHFLTHQFLPQLEKTLTKTKSLLTEQQLTLNTPCPEKILSPCDFGFHNALRTLNLHTGNSQTKQEPMIFLDFEYFGIDDPLKTISDFLLHPAMQLNETNKKIFSTNILSHLNNPKTNQRLQIIYPLVGLIWCLIILNEFVPEHQSRRNFANHPAEEKTKEIQLEKAQQMLNHIQECNPQIYTNT